MSRIEVGQVVDLATLSKLEAKVGDYKWSHLSQVDFNNEHLGEWMLCDGRSCTGTLFSTITGSLNVPNALGEGTFIRQAKSDRELGSFQGDAIRNISGSLGASHYQRLNGVKTGAFGDTLGATASDNSGAFHITVQSGVNFDASRVVPTAEENRPKNIALNLYVKVNY